MDVNKDFPSFYTIPLRAPLQLHHYEVAPIDGLLYSQEIHKSMIVYVPHINQELKWSEGRECMCVTNCLGLPLSIKRLKYIAVA